MVPLLELHDLSLQRFERKAATAGWKNSSLSCWLFPVAMTIRFERGDEIGDLRIAPCPVGKGQYVRLAAA